MLIPPVLIMCCVVHSSQLLLGSRLQSTVRLRHLLPAGAAPANSSPDDKAKSQEIQAEATKSKPDVAKADDAVVPDLKMPAELPDLHLYRGSNITDDLAMDIMRSMNELKKKIDVPKEAEGAMAELEEPKDDADQSSRQLYLKAKQTLDGQKQAMDKVAKQVEEFASSLKEIREAAEKKVKEEAGEGTKGVLELKVKYPKLGGAVSVEQKEKEELKKLEKASEDVKKPKKKVKTVWKLGPPKEMAPIPVIVLKGDLQSGIAETVQQMIEESREQAEFEMEEAKKESDIASAGSMSNLLKEKDVEKMRDGLLKEMRSLDNKITEKEAMSMFFDTDKTLQEKDLDQSKKAKRKKTQMSKTQKATSVGLNVASSLLGAIAKPPA